MCAFFVPFYQDFRLPREILKKITKYNKRKRRRKKEMSVGRMEASKFNQKWNKELNRKRAIL
jgi:hypothetical protein